MRRKRKHISLKTQLASALACLLPQAERDAYRAARVPAETILRLFSPDHIHLFALGGSDAWWNIDPKLRPAHAEKSRRDTGVVAKVKRLQAKYGHCQEHAENMRAVMRCKHCGGDGIGCCRGRFGRKIASRPNPWPPRGSRPFRPSP